MVDVNINRRLAKNTVLLYFRMLIIMVVTFYTTRILLQVLGIDDYGIYNTIAGVVVLFAFLNTAMVTTTQRFLNFYLGKGDKKTAAASFSISLIVHVVIGLLVVVLSEIVGLWFLYEKMSLPPTRFNAAFWTLHLSVFITFINIVKSPYNSCIIAYERMDFFAYISILEAILKLLIVFLLYSFHYDHLILYSVLLLVITIFTAFLYKKYCNRKYEISLFKFNFDKKIFFDLFQFSFYSLFGNAANMGAQHGVSLIVNSFTNVGVNAAIGVSNQLSHGIYSFVTNFQMAFNPILVKLYAQNELNNLRELIVQVSKLSYYMMIIISLPFIIYTGEFLSLWLDEVPKYSAEFCRLIIISLLIDTIAEPLWKTVQASGNIRKYQLCTSVIILLNLPIAYWLLLAGFSPIYIFYAKLIINAFVFLYRLFYVCYSLPFHIIVYLNKVIWPIALITVLLLFSGLIFYYTIDSYVLSSILILLISTLSIFLFGITSKERATILQVVKTRLRCI